MYRFNLLLLFLFCSTLLNAQDCANPLSNGAFQTGFNQVASQPTNEKKLERALALLQQGCFTSTQIKNLAILFSEDSYRLDFGKSAYPVTFDRVNFFEVYDAFTSFSAALRLYDFTRSQRSFMNREIMDNRPKDQPRAASPAVKFAEVIYPSTAKYSGNKGCAGPEVSETNFLAMAQQINGQPTDEAKYVAIETASYDNCFSMAQIMKLTSLVQGEKIRMRVLTETFARVYDQDHYPAAKALLSSTELQQQWSNTAQFALTPAAPPCEAKDEDVKSVARALQTKNFPDDKLALLATYGKDKCFSVQQVAALTREFTFEKDKLTAMKTLYPACPDKANYYTLLNELTFGYLQDELTAFLKEAEKK